MKLEAVKNGICRSNTGEKSVVFSSDLKLRPVLYAVYSGYQPNRGTIQGAAQGDVVASVTWDRRENHYELSRFKGSNLPAGEEAETWLELKKLYPWLDAWLEPEGRRACFLPTSVIPEQDYLSVR